MVGRLTPTLVASILLIFANSIVNAQEYGARKQGDPLIPTCRFEGALCGYVNPAGETVIAPKYDWADRFNEGRAKVRFAGLFGFIDESGQVVVPLEYDNVSVFWHGFAQVRKEKRTALIDLGGRVIVPAEWDHILPIAPGRFLVGNNARKTVGNGLGTRALSYTAHADWQFLDAGTRALTDLKLQEVRFLTKEFGSRFWAKIDGKFYLYDPDGTRLTEGFDDASPLRDGRAIVERGGLRGALNVDGEVVIPIKYDRSVMFTDDKWFIYHGARSTRGSRSSQVRTLGLRASGYIDRDGDVMIEARFDHAYAFEGDVARVGLDGDDLLINRVGEVVGRADGCQDGLSKEWRGDRFVILGRDGQPINDATYHFVKLICGAPGVVMPDQNRAGLVRADGSLVGGNYFRRVSPFYDGVAAVYLSEDLWGIIDEAGGFILEPMKIAVRTGSTGRNRTSINLPEGDVLLDRQVAERLARDPTPLLGREDGPTTCRDDGVTIIGKNGIVTYTDVAGKPMIRGAFDYAQCFGRGQAIVAMRDRQEWCKIDKRGNILDGNCHCS